jgi:prepilin-type N-terminal cleavage/methylation domain-containing protein
MARLFRESTGNHHQPRAAGSSVALWATVNGLFGGEFSLPKPIGRLVVPKPGAAARPSAETPPKLRKKVGPRSRRGGGAHGFTLIELLLVVAISTILAALMLPALSGAKAKAQSMSCLNNLKQLAVAMQAYMADNRGLLVVNNRGDISNPAATNSWVLGNMRNERDSTNTMLLRWGKLFPYASQMGVFHCPADKSMAGAGLAADYDGREFRVRSYAMNSWVGSRYMEEFPQRTGYRTFVKDSELGVAGAATVWGIADEHESSIDDGCLLVPMDDSQPFANFPATRHERGFGVNYLDGHAEIQKLRDPATVWTSVQGKRLSSANVDWIRFKLMTTIR